MSSSNCCFLTCIQVSQEAGQVVWYSHLFQNFRQFIVIHTVKGFDIVNKAEVDVFLELSCFFDDPADVGNLISGSPDFSKSSLNIWKFTVHVLLKPGLENFEHYFASVWDECDCAVVWAFFGIAFFVIGIKTDLFPSCGHCWVFQICWHIECNTFMASLESYRHSIKDHWSQITIANTKVRKQFECWNYVLDLKLNLKKLSKLAETQRWSMQILLEKMAPKNLFYADLPQTFNL